MARFSTELRGRVISIGFDDGGMNVLSSEALLELGNSLAAIPGQASLLLFRSTHASLFAAGADMREMARFTPEEARSFSQLGQELFRRIAALPLLTMVWVDGDCFGGALDLALSFDIRVASGRARFSHPGSRIGIVTGFGGTSRWRSVMGAPAARRLFLANPIIDAKGAQAMGLVDLVAGEDDLQPLLSRLARQDREVTALRKGVVRRCEDVSLDAGHLLSRRHYDLYSPRHAESPGSNRKD